MATPAHAIASVAATQREQRLLALLSASADAAWCIEFDEPIPTSLPADDQIDRLYRSGQVVEASDAAARRHGSGHADELIGTELGRLLPRDPATVALLRRFVAAGHRLSDPETGTELIGCCDRDRLLSLWVIQRAPGEPEWLESQRHQSQKLAAIGRLTSTVAHDFNNVLSALLSHTEALEYDLPDDNPLHVELAFLRETVQRGVGMTRQLAMLGKRRRYEPELVDIDEMLTSLGNRLDETAGAGVVIECRLDAQARLIVTDREGLEQAVLNLVANASEAMAGSGPLVIATTVGDAARLGARRGTARACLVLTVTDSGRGMDETSRERMFEPYFTTRDDVKGSGLGLSLVHAVVEHTGGTIAVESTPGKGTAIQLCLPEWVSTRNGADAG